MWGVGINLNWTAILEKQTLPTVCTDSIDNTLIFARTLPLIDFAGKREEEWHESSRSSQCLRQTLEDGDPDGFQLVSLDYTTTLSVQKVVTTTLSRMQKLGWPWAPWPWSDNSPFEVVILSVAQLWKLAQSPNCCTRQTCMHGRPWLVLLIAKCLRSALCKHVNTFVLPRQSLQYARGCWWSLCHAHVEDTL